jgi:hypothetical protein
MKGNAVRRNACLALVVLFLSLLSGCAATDGNRKEDHTGAIVGTGTGAAGGAVVGGVVGGKKGAVFGGLLGALAGGLLGDYYDRKEKGLQETRQTHPDDSAMKGVRVRIETVRSTPSVADPGDTIEIRMKYAVLTPRDDMTVPVHESREILFEGNRVGEAVVDIEREGGTWRSVVPVTLPRDARPGSYRVVASVETRNGGKDVEEITFRVR